MKVAGYRMRVARCRLQDAGYRLQATGCRMQEDPHEFGHSTQEGRVPELVGVRSALEGIR